MFRFDYRSSEIMRANAVLSASLYPGWIRLACIVVPIVVTVVFLSGAIAFGLLLGVPSGFPIFIVMLPAGVAGWWVSMRIIGVINRKAVARLSGISSIEGKEVRYDIEDEGVRTSSPGVDCFYRWASIDRVIAKRGDVFLVTGAWALFLPARAFSDAAQMQVTLSRIMERLTPEARARSSV